MINKKKVNKIEKAFHIHHHPVCFQTVILAMKKKKLVNSVILLIQS